MCSFRSAESGLLPRRARQGAGRLCACSHLHRACLGGMTILHYTAPTDNTAFAPTELVSVERIIAYYTNRTRAPSRTLVWCESKGFKLGEASSDAPPQVFCVANVVVAVFLRSKDVHIVKCSHSHISRGEGRWRPDTRDPDMVMSTVATVARPWMAQCPRSGERSYNRSPKTRTQFDAARCLAMRLLPRTKSVMSGSLDTVNDGGRTADPDSNPRPAAMGQEKWIRSCEVVPARG